MTGNDVEDVEIHEEDAGVDVFGHEAGRFVRVVHDLVRSLIDAGASVVESLLLRQLRNFFKLKFKKFGISYSDNNENKH